MLVNDALQICWPTIDPEALKHKPTSDRTQGQDSCNHNVCCIMALLPGQPVNTQWSLVSHLLGCSYRSRAWNHADMQGCVEVWSHDGMATDERQLQVNRKDCQCIGLTRQDLHRGKAGVSLMDGWPGCSLQSSPVTPSELTMASHTRKSLCRFQVASRVLTQGMNIPLESAESGSCVRLADTLVPPLHAWLCL